MFVCVYIYIKYYINLLLGIENWNMGEGIMVDNESMHHVCEQHYEWHSETPWDVSSSMSSRIPISKLPFIAIIPPTTFYTPDPIVPTHNYFTKWNVSATPVKH